MTDAIKEYHAAVCEAYRLGNVETAFNLPIINLLKAFGCSARDLSGARGGKAGENIDIQIWQGDTDVTETRAFAGVEVKKAGGIDERARGQIKTEAAFYGYAILTDNLVWQFWKAGADKMYSGVQLMELAGGKITLKKENAQLFVDLMRDFLLQDPAQIRSSNKLAEYMARHARTIRSVVKGILKEDANGLPLYDERQKKVPLFAEMRGLFERIKKDLRPLLKTNSFADMYAQTIVYGLFIARYNDSAGTFDRYKAASDLQEESPLLNRFFEHITNTVARRHPTLDNTIDKLCNLYQICDISALLGAQDGTDTIVHFYEDFLTFYDPALRKSLGVFYTPQQVVKYLVAQVDKSLVQDFGIEGGLSNNELMQITVECAPYQEKGKTLNKKQISAPRVAILDPACGTGTFMAQVIKYVKQTYFSGGRAGFWGDYIKSENGLLSRLAGFEIMMTSYVVAHLNVRRAVEETAGSSLASALPRALPTNIFLTNTLAGAHSAVEPGEQGSLFDFSAAITNESDKADTWKARRPIKVIIGNPPYLAASSNPFDISAYKTETDGVTDFGERNSKLLGDDYVKFFRFAEQIINKNGEGILAFVSNNGYLENTTFRGMRASLLRTFDKIYIVDLHGNSRKKEVAPDGGKDENIFDIMAGISLIIAIKTTTKTDWAQVYHADLWGTREEKFRRLAEGTIDFVQVVPDSKMAYLFPFGDDNKIAYEKGVSLRELFYTNFAGSTSGNDPVSIAPTRDELERRLNIVKHAVGEKEIVELFGKFTRDQTADKIKQDVLSTDGVITPVAYRPFDTRWTYYTGKSGGWMDMPREKNKMGQLLKPPTTPIGKNIGMVFPRSTTINRDFDGIFIANTIMMRQYIEYPSVGNGYIAPLYLHNDLDNTWAPNFAPAVLEKLTARMDKKPAPIEIFDYIYGILHDPVYRRRFNEYLKRDFPRVPVVYNGVVNAPKENDFCVTQDMFRAYVSAGEKLRKLHLLQTKEPAALTIEPQDGGSLEIASIKYKDGILWINPKKQICGIPQSVWEYRIGGYQVLDKWFKSHAGQTLTIDKFDHVCNITGLIAQAIAVQNTLRELHG